MIQITGIKASPQQTFNITEQVTGDQIDFTLYFRPRTRNWYFDITYNGFTLKGSKIVSSPNLLYQYYRIIPFGLACIVNDGIEPMFINDFSIERVKLYILTETERDQVISDINAGILA